MDQAQANKNTVQLLQRFSDAYGVFLSQMKQFPVDARQQPLPLYTYPAYEFLRQFDFSGENIFAYSAGASAWWWSTVAQVVYTIELEQSVHTFLKTRQKPNLQSVLLWKEDLDGFLRSIQCAEVPPTILTMDAEGGLLAKVVEHVAAEVERGTLAPKLIVVNDAARGGSGLSALSALRQYLRVDFHGLGPVFSNTWTTTLFLNCDQRLPGYQFRPSQVAAAI